MLKVYVAAIAAYHVPVAGTVTTVTFLKVLLITKQRLSRWIVDAISPARFIMACFCEPLDAFLGSSWIRASW